jgi:hypothetical protein
VFGMGTGGSTSLLPPRGSYGYVKEYPIESLLLIVKGLRPALPGL